MTEYQNAEASKMMQISGDTLTSLCAEADSLAKEVYELRDKVDHMTTAINSALDYLACMDRITPDKPNEQLAMDVLNEALGGYFQNGNTHGNL
jgi:hypothetical protein